MKYNKSARVQYGCSFHIFLESRILPIFLFFFLRFHLDLFVFFKNQNQHLQTISHSEMRIIFTLKFISLFTVVLVKWFKLYCEMDFSPHRRAAVHISLQRKCRPHRYKYDDDDDDETCESIWERQRPICEPRWSYILVLFVVRCLLLGLELGRMLSFFKKKYLFFAHLPPLSSCSGPDHSLGPFAPCLGLRF